MKRIDFSLEFKVNNKPVVGTKEKKIHSLFAQMSIKAAENIIPVEYRSVSTQWIMIAQFAPISFRSLARSLNPNFKCYLISS